MLLGLTPSAYSAEPVPLSAYGDLPGVEDMALSYTGKRVAVLGVLDGQRSIVIMNNESAVERLLKVGDAKVRSVDWIGDDTLVVQVSQTEKLGIEFAQDQFEFYRALIVPADPAAEVRFVFGSQRDIAKAVFGNYGRRLVGDHWKAYFGGVQLERRSFEFFAPHTRPALFSVDLETNQASRLAPPSGEGYNVDWLLAGDGTVAATFQIEESTGKWTLKNAQLNTLATGVATTGNAGLVSLGPDGTSAIYSEEDADDVTQWYQVALDGSAPAQPFLPDADIDRLFTDRASGRLLGYLAGGAVPEPKFFSPEHQSVARKIHRAFPQADMRLVDWASDFSRVLVRTSGSGNGGTWYIVDMKQMKANPIGFERPTIAPEQVGPISTVEYTAADGLALDGILTLPPGREAKDLPLIMLPHGGPHSHDNEGFDWWAQAFASRGYAVFQPNFRGSTNRDETFERAGNGEWGRKMQSDISDGLEELVRRGIVSRDRACIVGASYGGYAALAGVTLQQGLYRCAVSVAGVADIPMMYSADYRDSGQSGLLKRSLLEELGPRGGFAAISPTRFAAQADAPILLIHGRNDTVVPFNQSTKMADALKDAGKPFKFVELRNEDHWLSRADTRQQMLEETMAFVQEHNPAD
ncbi:MAG: S9 family peptidase [Porphyrobacter sp.]|nr:S9 family peptidase [Porphyrobacter sp.]